MAHSEDANPVMQNFCYILQVTIVSEKSGDEVENFTAFAYPGCLPGNAFGFNVHGLVFTANYVPQVWVSDNAIPRRVYNRALLGVRSETELWALFNQNPGIGSGFNFNITWLPPCTEEQEKPIRMFSVELASSENGACIAEKTISSGFNFHFNVYQDLKVPNYPCRSSERRQKRVEELLHHRDVTTKEKNLSAVCDIMSDVTDKDFPLFRDGREPDYLATMAVAIIDLDEETVDVYVDQPNSTKPIVTFSLRAGQNL
ncbi:uncharacterized protein LOC106173713 [Lingula anatina]|uniref:Uncharacterized protein LOC106173713 n=1 Tax=Lingula anatina TaxID=7574 RepID=A0A1S3JKE5_LINAN|nr:uncharacterized protein LOC106173713 [Lingula anatina]|eukprot:XP_013410379.1 uncharacterized protein LOC106173713 [Lingula anatina]